MSNNSDTISKLSDALTNLINAYETLQKEKEIIENNNKELENKNSGLEQQIIDLKAQKESLTTENNELSSKLDDITSNNEKQGSNINSMLSKIESILNVGDKPEPEAIATPQQNFNSFENTTTSIEIEEDEIFTTPVLKEPLVKERPEPVKVDDIQLEKRSDDKIDLNRMASLLNGFNK